MYVYITIKKLTSVNLHSLRLKQITKNNILQISIYMEMSRRDKSIE